MSSSVTKVKKRLSCTLVGLNYWPEPSGIAPYTRDLAEAIDGVFDVTVVTGHPHYPWWQKQEHNDSEYNLQHPNLSLVRVSHFIPSSQSLVARACMEISFGLRVIFSGKLVGDRVILVSPAMLSSALCLAWLRLRKPDTRVLVWVQD